MNVPGARRDPSGRQADHDIDMRSGAGNDGAALPGPVTASYRYQPAI